MNKAKVQQILEIEAQAQKIKRDGNERAKQLVSDAIMEAQTIKEKSEKTAEQEAGLIRSKAISDTNTHRLQQQSEKAGEQKEQLAKENFEKAVAYVLEQLTRQD